MHTALLIKAAACALTFALLPSGLVPFTVRLAFGAALFFFAAPFAAPAAGLSFDAFQTITWTSAAGALGQGVMLGISMSAAGFAALLFGRWLSRLAFGGSHNLPVRSEPLSMLIVLLALGMLFQGGYLSLVFRAVAQTLIAAEPEPALSWAKQAVEAGRLAFVFAFALALPFLCVSLLLDLSVVIGNRYLPGRTASAAAGSIRAPLLILTFSMLLFLTMSRFPEFFSRSIPANRITSTSSAGAP